jgi:Polyketide cyclase / dehydrase and lipid transport
MRLEAAQVIERRPQAVFRFVATDHFQNHPKWDRAIEQMTPTAPGPMAKGATARLVRRDRGKVMEGILTVTEYQPVRAFAAVSRFGPFTLWQRASLEPVPGGATRLHLAIDTAATGPIRLLLPLLKPQFRKTMAASLLTIKQHVEAQTPR